MLDRRTIKKCRINASHNSAAPQFLIETSFIVLLQICLGVTKTYQEVHDEAVFTLDYIFSGALTGLKSY